MLRIFALMLALGGLVALQAQEPATKSPTEKTQKKEGKASAKAKDGKTSPKGPPPVKPTEANVAYGSHPRQVLDFWKPESDKPTPLVVMIHGGGWVNGSKDNYARQVAPYLKEFASEKLGQGGVLTAEDTGRKARGRQDRTVLVAGKDSVAA